MASSYVQKAKDNAPRITYGLDDNEKFVADQETHLRKACRSNDEVPKQKHIRSAIMSTWQHQSSRIFWEAVKRLPLNTEEISCWKSLFMIHKMFQDGHPAMMCESVTHRSSLKALSASWKLRPSFFSALIQTYIEFLLFKLDFHDHFNKLPGDLNVQDTAPLVHGMAPDIKFEFSAQIMTLQEHVLNMQKLIFNSCSENKKSIELRLTPIIALVSESARLYDLSLHILTVLHKNLGPDTCSGHRSRFHAQFQQLKKFYFDADNLKFLHGLISVPVLRDVPQFFDDSTLQTPTPKPRPQPSPVAQRPITPHMNTEEFHDKFDSVFGASNSSPSFVFPTTVDPRDAEIKQLKEEIASLRQQLLKLSDTHHDDQTVIASLKSYISELERKLTDEREAASTAVGSSAAIAGRLNEANVLAAKNEEKFTKAMKMYQNLRGEHLALLKSSSNTKKIAVRVEEAERMKETALNDIEVLRRTIEDVRGESRREKEALQAQVKGDVDATQQLLERTNAEFTTFRAAVDDREKISNAALQASREEIAQLKAQHSLQRQCLIDQTVSAAKRVLEEALDEVNSPFDPGNEAATAEQVLDIASTCCATNTSLTQSVLELTKALRDGRDTPFDLLTNTTVFARDISDLLHNSKGTVRLCADGTSDILIGGLREVAAASMAILDDVGNADSSEARAMASKKLGVHVNEAVSVVVTTTEGLIPKDVEDSDKLEDIVQSEMAQAAQAISDAALRLDQIMARSKNSDKGLQLDVNESILESCKFISDAIRILIEKATIAQSELVSHGRGGASSKEFYKKNHRWTEGLISAAKAAGWAVSLLVENADNVVQNKGKMEELIVASKEVAAATAQLVASSRVKSAPNSQSQQQLEIASKTVTDATKGLVKAAKEGAYKLSSEAEKKEDYSKVSLTQAKTLEMNAQVRVIELESSLAGARQRLSDLRKVHYHLAAQN